MQLSESDFQFVIASAPLVSIDFLIINESNEVLLGNRLNRPAKGFWFVPGGRILKNETLENASTRILQAEVNLEQNALSEPLRLLGVFEHFYNDSVFSAEINTHYVAVTYLLRVCRIELNFDGPKILKQHSTLKWFDLNEALMNIKVHHYTKDNINAFKNQN